jgi:chromosome segregation ATPase
MAPFNPSTPNAPSPSYDVSPSDYYFSTPKYTAAPSSYSNHHAMIEALTQQLREKEMELRLLSQDNNVLEEQLRHKRHPSTLESAYEDLLAHSNKRDDEFRVLQRHNDELMTRYNELETKCNSLEHTANSQLRLLDEQDGEMTVMQKQFDKLRFQLMGAIESENITAYEKDERTRDVISLENLVERLAREVEFHKNKEIEAMSFQTQLKDRLEEFNSVSHRTGAIMDEQEREIRKLTKANKELQREMSAQNMRMQKQAEENGKVKRMLSKLGNELDEKDKEITSLSWAIERYEDIVEKAEHITFEQSRKMRAKGEEIDLLKDELKWEKAGIMSYYGCTGSS